MDRLSSIAAFVRTAEQGSFARAGRILGMHGSAVSKSVARLEEHLGLRLFHRTTRTLSLTAEGRDFLDDCERILDDLEAAESAMTARSDQPRGRLTVSMPVALGRMHLLGALTRLLAEFPLVEPAFQLEDRRVDLVAEGYDAAVRIGDNGNSGLIGRRLGRIRYVVCASDAYLEEMGEPRTPSELARHRCIVFSPSTGAKPLPWRFAAGTTLPSYDMDVRGTMRLNDAEGLVEAAAAGAGLVQLHSYLAAPAIAAGRLRPVLSSFGADDGPPLTILYPSARQLPARTRVFVDFVTRLLSPSPPWEAQG